MRKQIFLLFTGLVSLCLFSGDMQAQTKADAKYKKASEKLRTEIWGWDRPEFKKTAIPEKYAKSSKVVIAHHSQLTADSKTKLTFEGLGFGTRKDQTITEVVREMVRVNDKTAVEEYSELSFTRFERASGFSRSTKSSSFVGVRIIKPDGTIREVDADEMVMTKDERSEKRAKLAISDLEPGDIVDYYIATEHELTGSDHQAKMYSLFLFDEAPVLHYSFHAELGKKYAIDYRSYNGAPDLVLTKDRDKDIIIDVVKKDMPAYESSLWVAPALQLPMIRMNISLGYRGVAAKYLGAAKPGEVNKNLPTDEVVEAQSNAFAQQFYASYFMRAARQEFVDVVSDARKRAKAMGLSYNDLSDDEKALHLYYTTRFTKLLNFNINSMTRSIESGDYTYNGLAFVLNCILKAGDVDAAILVSSPRTGFRMNEILDTDDLESIAYLEGSKRFFHLQSIYSHPYEVPEEFDGVKNTHIIRFHNRAMAASMNSINKFAEHGPGFTIKPAKAEENAHLEQLAIVINPGETKLSVQRRAILRGQYKLAWQRRLILYEDFYEHERKLLGEEKSLLESLAENKKTKAHVDEVKNAFAEARKKQEQAFKEEAKSWFEQEVSDMKDYKIEKMGVRHTDPDFIYSCSFSLDGLVKKAGNNLIFEVGKIQGQPLAVKDEQRKREVDIYMPFARSFGYDMRIKIPEGYSVQGVEALNKTVENETGSFKAEASVSGDVIKVKVTKIYSHGFEPASNWDKMLAFIDAANEWTNAKLLFKKN